MNVFSLAAILWKLWRSQKCWFGENCWASICIAFSSLLIVECFRYLDTLKADVIKRNVLLSFFFCFHCFLKPNGVQGKLSLQRASLAASEAIARTPTKEKKMPKTGFITIATSNWVSYLVHATLNHEQLGNYLFIPMH